MRYCERWEKLNRSTGELTPISCKSWTCPKCRPAMEKALERKIIVARPTHFLTISWATENPPSKTTWQHYLRAERKSSGEFEAVTILTPGHLHAITRSTNPPSREIIKKFFDCQVVVEVFRPSQVAYCTSHLGKGARQRATTNFYKQVLPDRVSSGKTHPPGELSPRRRPGESSPGGERENQQTGNPAKKPDCQKIGGVRGTERLLASRAPGQRPNPPPSEKERSELGTIIEQLGTIINLLEGRKNPKTRPKKTEGFF